MKKTIRLARNSGFCFGVKRAIQIAEKAAIQHDEVVTLGPIIHNPQVVQQLKKKHIYAVDNLSDVENRPTILRSHGVPKQTIDFLKKKNVEIIDAICPYVARTQSYGQELDEQGYQIIIFGDKNHPEVKAVKSYIKSNAIIVETVEMLPQKLPAKIGIISQTTQRMDKLQKLIDYILPKANELRVYNTICNATSIRQKSTLILAQKSDIMIVIGGKNSSNTKQLAKICQKHSETYHIETSEELESVWFTNKYKIGLTAGASTPDWCILEVYNRIKKYIGDKTDKIRDVEMIPGFKEE